MIHGISLNPPAFSRKQRDNIARTIKPLDSNKILADFAALRSAKIREAGIGLRRTGNRTVDAFTYPERLNTVGNKGLDFFTFFHNRAAFSKKDYVRRMVEFCMGITKKTAPEVKCWLRTFTMYFGSVNIFRPLVAMKMYDLFQPKCVLDFTAGWGGRLVGAAALDVPQYIGIDSNTDLRKPYQDLIAFLKPLSRTRAKMMFGDALHINYNTLKYDMVLTSPPYYNLEVYQNAPAAYQTKKEWDDLFYVPLIAATFAGLAPGGYYCLNVSDEIYQRVCVRVLGDADDALAFDKNTRPNAYKEFIYVWRKPAN